MKHRHHDLIVKWAADPSQKVWFRPSTLKLKCWALATTPNWIPEFEYHLGPNPPAEKITLAGITFSAPAKEALELGQQYYFPCLTTESGKMGFQWRDTSVNYDHLINGLVFLSPEDAVLATKAMLKALNEAWG